MYGPAETLRLTPWRRLLDVCPAHGLRYFFFFNDTATTEIYTLSLHDALPISCHVMSWSRRQIVQPAARSRTQSSGSSPAIDRKSTRLNSSHSQISYAVFCLKKKNLPLSRCFSRIAPSRHP